MRKIEPLQLDGLKPNHIESSKPKVILIDPRNLRVDERYQRDLSKRSRRLIGKMVAGWDWMAFKPPIVAATDQEGIYDVVDGQHTSIAAATHPEVGMIPALLIHPEDLAGRAMSFVKHNRDRIAVSKVDEFLALVAAGDEHATDVKNCCDRHGISVYRVRPAKWEVGDTLAVTIVSDLVRRRYPVGAGRVFSTLVKAELAPIGAEHLRAAERLLFDADYKGEVTEQQITTALGRKELDETMRLARKFAAEHKESIWRALASVIFRDRFKRRA